MRPRFIGIGFSLLCTLAQPVLLAAVQQAVSDDFNRPDNTNLGPNWTEVIRDVAIKNQHVTCVDFFDPHVVVYNGFAATDATVSVDALPGDQPGALLYAGISTISRFQSYTDNAFIEARAVDNDQDDKYDRVLFYGRNGSPWNGMTGGNYFVDVTPFVSARLSSTTVGNTITLRIDRNFDGVPEDTITRGGIPSIGYGDGAGVSAFRDGTFDNFSASPVPEPANLAAVGALALLYSRSVAMKSRLSSVANV